MSDSLPPDEGEPWVRRGTRRRLVLKTVFLAVALAPLCGCGRDSPPAAVEGTLRMNGTPLDNCLVTFLPEPGRETKVPHSSGLTDVAGSYRLRFDNQQEGAAVGWHRITVQDLSASLGVVRRDHGTVDAGLDETTPPPPARRSRVPQQYMSPRDTPLRKEVKPGHQTIDLDVR